MRGCRSAGASERGVGVGHGKKAARNIDAHLAGGTCSAPPRRELASWETLDAWHDTDADRTVQPTLDAPRRRTRFDEVQGGVTEDTALFDARRCLSCGNCFECDNCLGVCIDNTVIRVGAGKRFLIDLDDCPACGMRASEWPCGAIRMVPEDT